MTSRFILKQLDYSTNVGPPFFKFMSFYIKASFTQRENHSKLLFGLDFATVKDTCSANLTFKAHNWQN